MILTIESCDIMHMVYWLLHIVYSYSWMIYVTGKFLKSKMSSFFYPTYPPSNYILSVVESFKRCTFVYVCCQHHLFQGFDFFTFLVRPIIPLQTTFCPLSNPSNVTFVYVCCQHHLFQGFDFFTFPVRPIIFCNSYR